MVLGALGRPASAEDDRARPARATTAATLLDSTKIRTELGWAPGDRVRDRASPRRSSGTPRNRAWWEPLLDRAPVDEDVAWSVEG